MAPHGDDALVLDRLPPTNGWLDGSHQSLVGESTALPRPSERRYMGRAPTACGIRLQFLHPSSHGHSPFQINSGRNPTLPIDLVPLPTQKAYSTEAIDYATTITEIHQLMKTRIAAYNAKVKETVDAHRRPLEYQQGDMVMIRLCPERYAIERAHKLHPRAAGPFPIRRMINPNAYDVAIPSDWGISSTFNICDLVAYQGHLEVPSEPGLPPNSTESSLSAPEENDGDSSPTEDTTANDPKPGAEPETYTGTNKEIEKTKERKGRPHRSAKPTTTASEYLYF